MSVFFGQKCKSLLEAFLCLSTARRIVNVWLEKSICRHIQPHCHQFRMNVAFLFFLLLSAMKQISLFVPFFLSVHECLCIREGKNFKKKNFFRNFLSKYKIDIFIGDEGKRRCFYAQLKISDFLFSRKTLRHHNSFYSLHTKNIMDSWHSWKWQRKSRYVHEIYVRCWHLSWLDFKVLRRIKQTHKYFRGILNESCIL